MTLPEEYQTAREIYQMCCILPFGQKISRAEINMRLRAGTDRRKEEKVSEAIRSLLIHNQIQKRLDRESCTVFFWATQNSTERGDPLTGVRNDTPPNYLLEPPPPTPAPTAPPPAKVTPPIRTADKPLRERLLELVLRQRIVRPVESLAEELREKSLDDVLDAATSLWEEGLIKKCAPRGQMVVWHTGMTTNYKNDTKKPQEAKPKKPTAAPAPAPTPKEEEPPPNWPLDNEELYMMEDLTVMDRRVLLRATGETVMLTVAEIEFIRKLKPPFVTL